MTPKPTPITDAQRSRSRFRTAALPHSLRETRIFVAEPIYESIRELAAAERLRLPAMTGLLLEFAVGMIRGSNAESNPHIRHATPAPGEPIVDLTQAILASRFPGDTGSARFRQLAYVHLVYAETLRGHRPTGAHLARLSGSQPSQMDTLTRTLRERGVIESNPAPGQNGAPWGKLLSIRADAVSALRQAHVAATGQDIIVDAPVHNKRRK
jgi:hypothetical protein